MCPKMLMRKNNRGGNINFSLKYCFMSIPARNTYVPHCQKHTREHLLKKCTVSSELCLASSSLLSYRATTIDILEQAKVNTKFKFPPTLKVALCSSCLKISLLNVASGR